MPNVSADAIVEITSTIAGGQAKPCAAPALPPGPALLLQQLIRFETAALSLRSPYRGTIEEVLSMDPSVNASKIAGLARAIETVLASA